MITRFGMSKKFGLMGLATVESQYLDGRASLTCSDVTAADIDTEVMKLLHDSYKKARKLLKENREIMDKLAAYLIEKETITGKEFMKIFRKEKGIPEPVEEETERFKDKKEEKAVEKSGDTADQTATGQPADGQPTGNLQSGDQIADGVPPAGYTSNGQSAGNLQSEGQMMGGAQPEGQTPGETPQMQYTPADQPIGNQQAPSGNRGLFSQAPDRTSEEDK